VRYTFLCQNSISALYDEGNKLAEVAAGVFSTTDDKLAKFLKAYPGVSVLSEAPEKQAPHNPGQFGPCPESSPTLHGGLTAGGVSGVRIRRQ
jgi:hypothetical protein